MKKRLLLVSLALALIMTTVVAPAPALARSARPIANAPTPFAATAGVMVVDPGTSIAVWNRVVTYGEVIQGTFGDVPDWPAISGAAMEVHHSSIITLFPNGTFRGNARAQVAVMPLSGGMLSGTYTATLQGQYMYVGGQLVILNVVDTGKFRASGRILSDDGRTLVTASGDWAADLFLYQVGPDIYTLAGEAGLSGSYQQLAGGSEH